MYPNHLAIQQTTNRRMQEDRRKTANEGLFLSERARLELMFWQIRVREVLEGIESVSYKLGRKGASVQDST